MDPENPNWFLATTLKERVALLRENLHDCGTLDATVAERKLKQWRTSALLNAEAVFAERLAADEISDTEFRQVLGTSADSILNRLPNPPRWFADFIAAFSAPTLQQLPPLPESLRDCQLTSLLCVVRPIIAQVLAHLHAEIEVLNRTKSDLPFDPRTIDNILYESLPLGLITILSRTAALELNVARLEGQLKGSTPEQRYQSFLERMSSRSEAFRMLGEYPVLTRLLIEEANRWLDRSLEFLRRLCEDWSTIKSSIAAAGNPGVLVKVDAGAGDHHNNGRSVLIANFDSGFRAVYKPRSLAVDVHFQDLLLWLNQRGVQPEFRTMKVLKHGSYAWTEFISAKSCESHEEVWRFYQRLGGYLAILYVLGATDFHYENLIAAGEHPVLIDLEALFHPPLESVQSGHADELAWNAVYHSVLGIGLLPQRIRSKDGSSGIDLSGIGAQGGQILPHLIPQWEGTGTDQMHLIRKGGIDPGGVNRPSIKGTSVDVGEYSGAILSGFVDTYDVMVRNRDELLAQDGPIDTFARDEIRILLRNTQTYGVILQESFHPDVLRDALDRDELFDRLWANVKDLPHLSRVAALEHDDLWKGDIPRFTSQPGTTDIWATSGKRVANVCAEPGIEVTKRRLCQMGVADQERQAWIIRASLANVLSHRESSQPVPVVSAPIESPASRCQLLEAALEIGERLETIALRGEDDVSWIGMAAVSEHYCSPVPLGSDLYEGLPGVLLFLAFLGKVTGQERYTHLARAALTTLRRQINHSHKLMESIGGFVGWGGIVYVLGQLGALWSDSSLFQEADEVIEDLLRLIPKDEQLDILGGVAGGMVALIGFHEFSGSDRALTAAMRCGERLLDRAQTLQNGVGWKSRVTGEEALTGFSHGVAGIAWSLLRLSAISNENRFRVTALDALAYERSLFSEEFQNWPDLRSLETSASKRDNPGFMAAWCHGAPGIGLGRLASLAYLDNDEMRADINAALRTTLKNGFGGNHSLCHGDLGNIELLLQASEKLADPQWSEHLSEKTALILQSIRRSGFICGVPSGVETPGLMTGLAGIGYELLRLAEPTRVPCVLLLEPMSLSVVRETVA